ncbi:MAG: hypothetical protein JRJ85_13200, partial [Deltaproteobacteria bacterium]|nr:hypothetical protein [Deltaproteobacteria bacterium]
MVRFYFHVRFMRVTPIIFPMVIGLLFIIFQVKVVFAADGDLDTTFSTDGIVTTAISGADDSGAAVAIQPDGRMVVAGTSAGSGNKDFAVVRYNTNSSLDSSFSTDGQVTTDIGTKDDTAAGMAIQPDGKIVVVGTCDSGSSSNDDFAIVRYNTDGSLDATFDTDGGVTTAVSALD